MKVEIAIASEFQWTWWKHPFYTESGWEPTSAHYYQATLVFVIFIYVFETYLNCRQYKKLKEKTFPSELKRIILEIDEKSHEITEDIKNKDKQSLEGTKSAQAPSSNTLLETTLDKFDKSRAYGLAKCEFTLVSELYHLCEGILFMMGGYLVALWTLSGYLLSLAGWNPENEIIRAVIMLFLSMLRDTVAELPFELYSTFVIEQRHGFNKQTIGIFLVDKLKQLLLMVAIGYPLTAILIFVVRWGGEYFYLYTWLFLFVFSLIMLTIIPIWIMPLFNKFTPLEEGSLRSDIEALAASLKFPLTKLFVCDGSKRSSHSNAYLYGLYKNKRIVLFDTLLEQASNEEIVAILGHELGHWKLWHTGQSLIFQQVYTFACLYLFGLCMNDADLFANFGFATKSKPVMIGFLLFTQTLWAPVNHVLSFMLTLNTRKNEFQADAFATDLGHAKALQTGLTKISTENLSNMNPDKWYSAYHYDHPPLLERLSAIKQRESKRQ
uniref:CAAX prenyl protease n=1 Tax=Albugo laibachii Nc14 TaxID=890382 RepID=F0WC48_9STRA|nr:CAAX prenyl protease 1 putative [Albugo laibachii Nc14]CCA25203.1 CAAX prenyl protease 1 putative [Albugo laibachii Nc14]|eukprot:CCA25203.1 CAAX prenyl protease 1 putative [Albugo laibachii Nc14]